MPLSNVKRLHRVSQFRTRRGWLARQTHYRAASPISAGNADASSGGLPSADGAVAAACTTAPATSFSISDVAFLVYTHTAPCLTVRGTTTTETVPPPGLRCRQRRAALQGNGVQTPRFPSKKASCELVVRPANYQRGQRRQVGLAQHPFGRNHHTPLPPPTTRIQPSSARATPEATVKFVSMSGAEKIKTRCGFSVAMGGSLPWPSSMPALTFSPRAR